MRVLTICSSYNQKPGAVVQNQVASLVDNGIENQFYFIQRKGWNGYLWHILDFRKFLKKNNDYELVHAHYSLCGFVAALAGAKPLIVSLMGSDGQRKILKPVLKLFHWLSWDHVIVKSADLQNKTGFTENVSSIPNGVSLHKFPSIEKKEACRRVGFNQEEYNILFLADPSRREKNANRAKQAVKCLTVKNVKLQFVHDIPHSKVNEYLQACDVLLLTSDYEGSPNIIKEALAANCKIVTTPVGDVQLLLNGLKGTYISSFDPKDIAKKIEKALAYPNTVKGRQKIQELELDSDTVAKKIIDLYNTMKN